MKQSGAETVPPGGALSGFRLVSQSRDLLPLAALATVFVLRLLTLARDTWEWDELLFFWAARDGIDVRVNHPHAPGYPLFVLPARLLVLLGASPFGATLGIALVAGIVAIVFVVLLARELGAGKEESLWAGLLWACIPAVWLHSVRPLTDSLGAAAFLLAVLLLVRGARMPDGGGLVVAALAVGATAGVRPQVAIALLPFALVVALRAPRTLAGARRAVWAAGAGLAVGLLPYFPVVAGSGGLVPYLAAAKGVARYVQTFEAPTLSALATAAVWERWLVDPFGGAWPAAAFWLAAASVVVAPRAARLVAVAFLPLLFFSVATLNPATAPRYGIAFLAAGPLSAALGLSWLRARKRWLAAVLGTALLAIVVLPAARPLAELASRPSPPVAAMAALREDPVLRGRQFLVDPGLWVHRKELGPGGVLWRELQPGRPLDAPLRGLVVTHDRNLPGLQPLREFRFESEVLRRISRARYLQVTIWDAGAAPDTRPFKATDDNLLSSVDDPPEGAVVRPPLFVRGWCQERGGGPVVPVEFRVDGVAVVPERLDRKPRPDVSAAIPEVGDASRAGYEAFLPAGAVAPGRHVLEVVFETADRRRVYPRRRFTLAATSPATPGPSSGSAGPSPRR
jgi:hypothetical protein